MEGNVLTARIIIGKDQGPLLVWKKGKLCKNRSIFHKFERSRNGAKQEI